MKDIVGDLNPNDFALRLNPDGVPFAKDACCAPAALVPVPMGRTDIGPSRMKRAKDVLRQGDVGRALWNFSEVILSKVERHFSFDSDC